MQTPRSFPGSLLDERALVLVTGKGGTGKSTLTAALAAIAAQRSQGAVAVELSANPRMPAMLPPGTRVRAVNLDLENCVVPVLARLTGVSALANAAARNKALKAFMQTSPAMREMFILDELRDLVEKSSRERTPVVVDLPATGHALSLLDTPGSVHRMLRVGPFAQVAKRAQELLLDQTRTELVAVALPEELPINETIELLRRARDIGVRCRTVVVSRVPATPVGEADLALLAQTEQHGGQAVGRLVQAARQEHELAQRAQEQIERLRAALPVEIVELPLWIVPDLAECVRLVMKALSP
jgi:anion-transporting  ArsA/GET3 family ATPase